MKLEWCPETAGQVYMDAMRVLEEQESPTDVAEFLATTAGGWKAQFILEAWLPGEGVATSLGLQAAAKCNHGRHICILPDEDVAREYVGAIGGRDKTEVVVGDAEEIVGGLEGLDFAVVDWRREDAPAVLRSVKPSSRGAVIVCMEVGERGCVGARWRRRLRDGTRLVRTASLPIGRGLQVLHVGVGRGPSLGNNSRWITHVDSQTGEEHVFRRTDQVM